jgi:hypothetical protein
MLSRGCDEIDRSDGIGHDYCCGDLDVIRVFTDSAGDGLLECCVRFQVDQEEADVCLKLLCQNYTSTAHSPQRTVKTLTQVEAKVEDGDVRQGGKMAIFLFQTQIPVLLLAINNSNLF